MLVENKVMKKTNDFKYLRLTIVSSLSFTNHVKQISTKLAEGIKTIDSIGTHFPASSLEILLQSVVLTHLNFSALFIQHIRKPIMTFLEKQLNWGNNNLFLRSNCKASLRLRIKNKRSGLNRELISVLIFFISENISGEKINAFNTTLMLPSEKYSNNKRTQKIFFHDHRSTSFLDKSFFNSYMAGAFRIYFCVQFPAFITSRFFKQSFFLSIFR